MDIQEIFFDELMIVFHTVLIDVFILILFFSVNCILKVEAFTENAITDHSVESEQHIPKF